MSKSLQNKLLITLGFLLLYRILGYITIPGIDVEVIKSMVDGSSNNFLKMANLFSGNAIARMSIISLGIMPYITASIIMELLASSFKTLGDMKKEKEGMVKYMQIIRYATIAITSVQAVGISMMLYSSYPNSILIDFSTFMTIAIVAMVTGTMILMWIGEQITQKGIGNGISLIIVAGIVSGLPKAVTGTIELLNKNQISFIDVIAIVAIILVTVLVIIYIELGERRIKVNYINKSDSNGPANYIPIKINLSGVIPAIFASAVLMFPSTMFSHSEVEFLRNIADYLNPNTYTYNLAMFIFVVFFAFFYTSITFNTKDMSKNLQSQNSYIAGIRPGEETEKYLNTVASRLTLFGSLYLGLIATIPWLLVKGLGVPFYFGGVMVLIVVQVSLDTVKKIQAEMQSNEYKNINLENL